MIFLMPIGRKGGVSGLPWATAALIAVTTAAYFFTWPSEKSYRLARLPGTPLNAAARTVAALALQDPQAIPADLRLEIQRDGRQLFYPTPRTPGLFKAAAPQLDYRPLSVKVEDALQEKGDSPLPAALMAMLPGAQAPAAQPMIGWKQAYDRFQNALRDSDSPDESVFDRFAFNPNRSLFPGLITHMFLHAGFFHLFFNMLFLWIVGCGIEERWGAPLFLGVYLVGGVLAAVSQQYFSPLDINQVGASGAVAAVMGAFLIRHYKMPLRMVYFIWLFLRPKWGSFYAPAWTMLLLWLGEQLFWGVLTMGNKTGGTGYWAHVGGFAVGVMMGFLIRRGGWADANEREAETSDGGVQARLDEAQELMAQGQNLPAREIYEKALADAPDHPGALVGMYRITSYLNEEESVVRLAPRVIKAAVQSSQYDAAEDLIKRYRTQLLAAAYEEGDLLALGSSLEKLQRGADAAVFYERLLKERPATLHRGRVLFALGKIYRSMNKFPEARRCLEELTQPPLDFEWRSFAEAQLQALPPPL
jgi:membrane associated rhomboid family serine protease